MIFCFSVFREVLNSDAVRCQEEYFLVHSTKEPLQPKQPFGIVLVRISRSHLSNDHSIGGSCKTISKTNNRSGRSPQTTAKELVTKQQVRNMIASNLQKVIETKVTYINSGPSNISYTGSITNLLNSLSRGDGSVNQYAGNLLRPESLCCRFYLSTDQNFSTLRIICFQWADASVPTTAGILEFTGGVTAPISPLAWLNHHKVHVLFDIGTCLKNRTAADASYYSIRVKGDKMRTIQMSIAVPNVAQMYGIYFLAISDDSVVNFPQIALYTELRFTDA